MALPITDVTLPPDRVEALNQSLSTLRHNVNNHLSLIVAATELIRRKPESAERLANTLAEQPQKIVDELRRFSDEFERALQINRTEAHH